MKKIYKETTLSVYEDQDNLINPTFLKCKINVLNTSSIANNTHFSKVNVDKFIYQLDYLPVRGFYKEDEGKFGGHEISYYLEDGELKESVKTVPMGVVINNSARWEYVDNKETLVCDCYIWTNNNEEATKRIKENCVSQSMEIIIDNYSETNKDYIEIEEFTFTSLAIIDTKPAFEGANIRTYSKNDFEADYKHMIEALNKYLNYEKGGEEINMDKNKDLNTNSQEEFEKDNKEKEEISSNKKNCEDNEAKDKELKDEEDYENKINELNSNYSSLEAKYSELETSNKELKSKYEVLLEEVTLLRQYKADKEEAYRQSEETRIFSQFESLKGNEKFDKLVSESRNYDLEELEEKCFAIYGMVSKAKVKANKKEEKKPIVDKVYSEESVNRVDKLSATFEKYLNK